MNYLAHLLLSGPDADIQVGGLLGDFVKGSLKQEFPDNIEFGIFLHRKIDVFTDQHALFVEAATIFPDQWRRYRGILLDMYFDFLLATRWDEFHHLPLQQFCENFYSQLLKHRQYLPPKAQHFCDIAPQVNWLESYALKQKLPIMLNNVGKRLKRPVAFGDAWPLLEREHHKLNDLFEPLLAELVEFSTTIRHQNAKP